MRTALLLSVLFSFSFVLRANGEDSYKGPVFDSHLHYSATSWAQYSPGDVLQKLDSANVKTALLSSTPNEGTAKLLAFAPGRMVPGLRPYRNAAEKVAWYKNSELVSYTQTRLATLRHKAFGEVILGYREDLETPQMAQYLAMAEEQNLVLHFHTSAAVIEALFEMRPNLKILWAHAGFSEPPDVITRLLDQNPNLWAELSYRAEDIMGGTDLEPEWKTLLLRHATRFTIGSDTWQNGRWQNYQYLIDQHREWLGKLPQEVAGKIAYQNAEVLFR